MTSLMDLGDHGEIQGLLKGLLEICLLTSLGFFNQTNGRIFVVFP